MLLRLPPGTNAARVVARAEGVTAGAATDYGGLPPNAIRLNFAAPASDSEIEPGIERLAASYALPAEPRARLLENQSSIDDYCVTPTVGYALEAVQIAGERPAKHVSVADSFAVLNLGGRMANGIEDQGERPHARGAGEP